MRFLIEKLYLNLVNNFMSLKIFYYFLSVIVGSALKM